MSALHVLFKVADSDYALPAAEVLHMETFERATPVPGAAPYVAGVMQSRRRVVPVVDLRARFGLRAVLGGSIATFMTATIAGVIYMLQQTSETAAAVACVATP